MPTDTPNLLAALDAAAELGKAATKRPWANHYIVAAANLDHAAIAASLRAKDAEIAGMKLVIEAMEAEKQSIFSDIRSTTMKHGLCQPRERKACTACNALERLQARIVGWKGCRIYAANDAALTPAAGADHD